METPLVSIKTITYNHAPYIKQCIEGVLMQKTNFKFEFVIGEDCSTDETREIVKEYAEKYPETIKLIISEANVGARENSRRTHNACTGKYIAFCEGDDYWTDPYKLQKQVDFLEAHPDYGMVHTGFSFYNNEKGKFLRNKPVDIPQGEVFENMLSNSSRIGTLTVLLRSNLLKDVIELIAEPRVKYNWKVGDLPLWLGISRISKVGYIADNTSVYRVLGESASHFKSGEKIVAHYESFFGIKKWFCENFATDHILNIINEEELFIIYYKTLIGGFDENKYYKELVSKHKMLSASFWKRVLYLTAKNGFLFYSFRRIHNYIWK